MLATLSTFPSKMYKISFTLTSSPACILFLLLMIDVLTEVRWNLNGFFTSLFHNTYLPVKNLERTKSENQLYYNSLKKENLEINLMEQ